MEETTVKENITELSGKVKDYIRLRVNLLKLSIVEKLSLIGSFFLVSVIFFILFLFVLMFLSLAFIFWFKENGGSASTGALIVGGFYVFIGIIIYLFRKKLFINPLIEKFTRILMEESDENEK